MAASRRFARRCRSNTHVCFFRERNGIVRFTDTVHRSVRAGRHRSRSSVRDTRLPVAVVPVPGTNLLGLRLIIVVGYHSGGRAARSGQCGSASTQSTRYGERTAPASRRSRTNSAAPKVRSTATCGRSRISRSSSEKTANIASDCRSSGWHSTSASRWGTTSAGARSKCWRTPARPRSSALRNATGCRPSARRLAIARSKPPRASAPSSPIYATGLGKTICAYVLRERVEELVAETGFVARTRNAITTPKESSEELEAIRDRGYGIDGEENINGLRCVAPPVRKGEKVPGAAQSAANAVELDATVS